MLAGILKLLFKNNLKSNEIIKRNPEIIELIKGEIARSSAKNAPGKNLPFAPPPGVKDVQAWLKARPLPKEITYDYGNPVIKIPPRVPEGGFIKNLYRGETYHPVDELVSTTGKNLQGVRPGGFHSSDLMEARQYALDSRLHKKLSGLPKGIDPNNPGVIRELTVNRPWEKMKKYWSKNVPRAFESESHFVLPEKLSKKAKISMLKTLLHRWNDPMLKNPKYKDKRQMWNVFKKIYSGAEDWKWLNRGGITSL